MSIQFPIPTFIGQQFFAGGKGWRWNGFAWDSIANTQAIGATGATGLSGSTGATGATGPSVNTSAFVQKTGDTMTGKLNLPPSTTSSAGLNLGNGVSPTTTIAGDVFSSGNNIFFRGQTGGPYIFAYKNDTNTFLVPQIISTTSPTGDSAPALRITQAGGGEALRFEYHTTPDPTPFVVSTAGKVGVGVTPDATVGLKLDSTGVKFGDGTIQTTAGIVTPASSAGTPNTLALRNGNGSSNFKSITFETTSEPANYTQEVSSQLGAIYLDAVLSPPKTLSAYYVDDGLGGKTVNFNTSFSFSAENIGVGLKSFTTQSGLSDFYYNPQTVTIKFDETNQMFGTVLSYNNTTGVLVVNVTSVIGTGTQVVWSIISDSGKQSFEYDVQNGEMIWLQMLSGSGTPSNWYEIYNVEINDYFTTLSYDLTLRSGTCTYAFFQNSNTGGIASVTANPNIAGMYCVNHIRGDLAYNNFPPYNPLIRAIGLTTANLTTSIIQNDADFMNAYSTAFRVTTLAGVATAPYRLIFTSEAGA